MEDLRESVNVRSNSIGIHDDDHTRQIAYSNSEPRLIHVGPPLMAP